MFQVPVITSNQTELHPKLQQVLQKHLQHPFRPPACARREALRQLLQPILAAAATSQQPVLLDSGCGRGESSLWLAETQPDQLVLGVDKSLQRLERVQGQALPANLHFIRAELTDLWLLAWEAGWRFEQLKLFYPNPWPKAEHLKRRWHGHPIFPYLLHSCEQLELRTNWELYAQEFAWACSEASGQPVAVEAYTPQQAITAFERKYLLAGQPLYRVCWQNPGYRFQAHSAAP